MKANNTTELKSNAGKSIFSAKFYQALQIKNAAATILSGHFVLHQSQCEVHKTEFKTQFQRRQMALRISRM